MLNLEAVNLIVNITLFVTVSLVTAVIILNVFMGE